MDTNHFWIIGLALAAFVLPACSLFGDEHPEPEPQPHFQLLAEPKFHCRTVFYSPSCYWSAEAELTHKQYVERYITKEPFVDLVLDDSTSVLNLMYVELNEVPLEVGHRYRFEADLLPTPTIGWPSLKVTDDSGLVFFAASVLLWQEAASILLAPEAWSFAQEASSHRSRKHECGDGFIRETPVVLHVEHEGHQVRLMQGETAQLGTYTIQCRVARTADYSHNMCFDYVLPELSLVIFRTPT